MCARYDLTDVSGMASYPSQIGPAKALKAIAMFVSERDNGVRLAALNAIVVVYDLVGENVYKLIGPIADKDLRSGSELCAYILHGWQSYSRAH